MKSYFISTKSVSKLHVYSPSVNYTLEVSPEINTLTGLIKKNSF